MRKIITTALIISALVGIYFIYAKKNIIQVGKWETTSSKNQKKTDRFDKLTVSQKGESPITGVQCDTGLRRPYAVMLAGDKETRPLSGIGQADLVVEMPVAPNSVTRFMAVYQCQTPKEIGSVRSARDDFIPLAGGFNVIYGHWGGEHGALEKLDSHVLDNINALNYDGTTYYRKKSIPRPHNGFTIISNLEATAKQLGYDLNLNFSGYPHVSSGSIKADPNLSSNISVSYPAPFEVTWKYDPASKTYKRWRSGQSEIDRNNNQQVGAKVLVIMHTTSRFLRDQYIEVDTVGSGQVDVYQGGSVTHGTWFKDPKSLTNKLVFKNSDGREVKFIPGNIWIEIVTQ